MGRRRRKDRVSLKDVRGNFYQLRDFEITHLWQRSIFLAALLAVSFSAYGALVSMLLKKEQADVLVIHEVCCGVALLGVVSSIIWVMMAKASKAWYEVYEKRVWDIEQEKSLGIPEKYRMGEGCSLSSIDSNLLTTKAGCYSVSRLNIFIGIVLMITWTVILLVHYIGAIYFFGSPDCRANCVMHTVVLVLLPVAFVLILITAACNKWAKSTTLTHT